MACTTSFEFHHNFPKLAEESGFAFNLHKPRVHTEWNKIKLIDIESLVRERKFETIEQHINDILHCGLETEFDVRILDEGVHKIFRLAQLAVEYQQFCRHYLDRSVYVLREEVTNLLKELDTTKRSLREKEEDIRKLKRKNKQYFRTSHPYGNESIATMFLKTINQNKGDIFNSTSQSDVYHNRCGYCEKVFLNQLYLKGHILRRHPNAAEIPQKQTVENDTVNDNLNPRLNEEITELKVKLKQMEELLVTTHSSNTQDLANTHSIVNTSPNNKPENNKILSKEMKDVEVLANDDGYLLDKIEEWKKQEHDKYNKEINLLRNQMTEFIKDKEKQDQASVLNDSKIMDQLRTTIKQQGEEIITLKKELLKGENSENEKRNDIETQLTYWIKQTEMQSAEYKALLQKLNDVTNEVEHCRAQTNAEKEKSKILQELLQQNLRESLETNETLTKPKKNELVKSEKLKETPQEKQVRKTPEIETVKPTVNFNTLEKLQQKAHELLYVDQTSTTDSSIISDDKVITKSNQKHPPNNLDVDNFGKYKKQNTTKSNIYAANHDNTNCSRPTMQEKPKKKSKLKLKSAIRGKSKNENGHAHIPGSPMKVVRAKIVEEVNLRLSSLGIDPLKNRLPANIFQKKRMSLQKQQEMKIKKFPVREKLLHAIMTDLDINTSKKKTTYDKDVFVSPNKSPKTFNISSVFTNVKTKALSLVKSTESVNKCENSYNDAAKRAMSLLMTPPGSTNSSPKKQKYFNNSPNKDTEQTPKSRKEPTYRGKVDEQSEITETQQSIYTDDESDSTTVDDNLTFDRSKKIDMNVMKSPIRRPKENIRNGNNSSISTNKDQSIKIKDKHIPYVEAVNLNKEKLMETNEDSSDGIESIEISPKKYFSEENISKNSNKQTKGVLKNASSTSSLNKKKVLFDMEAIQMKSVSASPSQSITEKTDGNHQFDSGITNLDMEEWDISSIETELNKPASKIQVTSYTSPKIAELKKTIESQLTRRNPTLSTPIFGGVDVLTAPVLKGSNFGGSNTSVGSSILDDADNVPIQNDPVFIKAKAAEKDDSEIEISDLINDAIDNKNYIKSF